jgi:hypothetical protein
MPSPVLRNFLKIPTTVSRPIARAKGFYDGNSISRKVKIMAYAERRAAVRPKLLMVTPPWLQPEDLRALFEFLGLHPTSFQKYSSDRLDSDPKK